MFIYEFDLSVIDTIRYCMEDQADPDITEDAYINKQARSVLSAIDNASSVINGIYSITLSSRQIAFLLDTLSDYANPAIIKEAYVRKSAKEAYDAIVAATTNINSARSMRRNKSKVDLNSARDNGWELVKTADVEIDGGEITDATLYAKDGIYMMVIRGESNYGPDEDYAEWDTDNYREAVTKFREFVVENRPRKRRANSARLNSADQGFIKIGNKVIPTNTMDMGYADYDTVARRGREDYEAQERAKAEAKAKEEADRKAAELAAKGAKLYDDFTDIVHSHTGSTDELDSKLNDLLIPASGMAETFAGELLRAAERIGYRYNNDGDLFYADYGLETAGSSACFLGKYGDEYISKIITDMAEHEVDWPGYDKAVDKLFNAVVDMLADDPELFKTAPPEDSRDCYTEELDKWKEWHSYNWEISESDFEYPSSQGWLSNSDIDDWVRGIAEPYDCEIEHPYRDYWELTGLDSEAYRELNEYYVRWIDEWVEELASEHEEEEEEEYDDEEE